MGSVATTKTLTISIATEQEQAVAQRQVKRYHYLHAPVDARCSVFTYVVRLGRQTVGCLIFGRPESTACYAGELTYGSLDDIAAGRAQYSRWELLNLARVWLSPDVQPGGPAYRSDLLPGYVDRKGTWRSRLASTVILLALDRIVVDYLVARPPCYLDEPYQLREVISYCDTRLHRGTIYKAAGFRLVRTNKEGIQTWAKQVRPLTVDEDQLVQRRSLQHPRSRAYRARRAMAAEQLTMEGL